MNPVSRVACVACTLGLLAAMAEPTPAGQAAPRSKRPRIGVAFGGGSARGLAHVGVVRWFEEHRIPIDLIAGTSMGGLIGGALASGMSAEELTALLETDRLGRDVRLFAVPLQERAPQRGRARVPVADRVRHQARHRAAVALNNGQQVDFLLARIAGPYADALELRRPADAVPRHCRRSRHGTAGRPDKGSLASAMRATMSLPGIFPPVERDGRVLVDGGAMNNVPADVVRAMGADVVIAVNVGFMGDTRTVSRSLLGLMGQTVDVMMQASTRDAMKAADIVINPPLEGFASLDWRRSAELAADGYRAAEAMKDKLLPLALDEAQWAAYQRRRQARRKTALPAPQFVSVVGRGAVRSGAHRGSPRPTRRTAARHQYPRDGSRDVCRTGSLRDRGMADRRGGRPAWPPRGGAAEAHAPPFLMLGISLQNTTTDDFAFQLAARYLTFDAVGSGSELRVDGAVGAQPSIGAELYRPIGRTPLFVAGAAGASSRTLNFMSDDVVVARYSEVRALVGFDAGVNLGRDSDVRLGMSAGRPERECRGRRSRPAGASRARDARAARLALRRPGQPGRAVEWCAGDRRRSTTSFDSPDAPATSSQPTARTTT